MTRRIYRKPQVTVSLFPFLAVLVCTMGALIVLLVLVVQQVRVHATVITDVGPTAKELAAAKQLKLAREDNQWRREILEQQRLEMTKKQSDHRLQLSHLEDHIRRLEEKWNQLQANASNLTASADSDAQTRENTAAELAKLRAAIDQARQDLNEAKLVADQRPRSFAIIPYRGPNGTQRRPIFIECTAQGIVLQPEGLVITGADLNGPLGPGNPLDAALRATREYLVATGAVGEGEEPYPLLVVRPGGTEAYGAARNAMKSWDDEFGYELIEAEAKLQYPAADPVLHNLIARSLKDARQRQEILAAAMPSQFGGRGGSGGGVGGGGMVATPYRGGFVPAHQASNDGGRRGGWGSGQGETSRSGSEFRDGAGSQHGAGSQLGTGSEHGTGSEQETGSQQGDPSQPDTAGQLAEQQGNQAGQEGNPLRRDGQQSASGGQPGGTGGPNSGGSALGASRQGARGANWALPKASRHATGVTRPVRVACWPDRLLILPEQGDQSSPRTVKIDSNLADQIDEFVSEIWKHTDGWGLALAGGYWKPVVNVEVAPGGEPMFLELEALLQGSGLEVKKEKLVTRKRKIDQAEAPGQDSFLDIVANLVGILIILVIVIGVRAKDAMLEAAPVADTEVARPNLEKLAKDADAALSAANSVETDILDLETKIKRQDLEIAFRRREREKIQMLVAQAEEAIAQRRDELSATEQQRFDAQREVLAARQELETVQVSLHAVQNSAAPVTVIEHLPTPMAKTVFGKELHFRLHNGKLAYVPWDQLVERLQEEAPQKVWRLKEQPELTETFGPIGRFWMKYTLKRVEYRQATQLGVAVQRGIELDRFILIPENDDMGEPLAEALQPGSRFQSLLAENQPEATTITVWTYPDSFDAFRELKRVLFQRNYLTASRPLSFDTPIGGSPRGTRSAAQ